VEFQVFKNGKIIDDFTLCGAYLFGSDGIGVRRTQITFNKGVITCRKPNPETAGLALLWPVDGFGKVLLPTTCLPERPRAYNLNVEVARAKLMQIINKREDWSFFDGVAGLKAALDMLGYYGGPVRSPLLDLSASELQTLQAILVEGGVL